MELKMNLNTFLQSIDFSSIISEQDVRTKIAIPLIECLGYPVKNRAEEFPVFGFEGRKKMTTKFVDIMLFSKSEHSIHRDSTERAWVMDHSLVAIELKKPTEEVSESQGQAQFYAMWTRALYYICTNGKAIVIYKLENFNADTALCCCKVMELERHWLTLYESIAFKELILKKEPQLIENKVRYQEYCLSRVDLGKKDEWCWDQRIFKTDSNSKNEGFSTKDLTEIKDNILLLAHAGVGKTTCLKLAFQEYINRYLIGDTTKVPIYLSAKFWKRNFNTIEEGVYKELTLYLPYLTEEIIRLEFAKGNYCLFIDGLDECLVEKDLLIEEIKVLSNYAQLHIIITCRTERYYNECEGFGKFFLETLKENEIIAISTRVLEYDTTTIIRNMDENLRKLIIIPLYLHMWISYCKNHYGSEVPKNTANLFDGFISFLLRDYLAEKGNYNFELIPISTLKSILSRFAYLSFDNKNQVDLSQIIIDAKIGNNHIQEAYRILFQSGLLSEFDEIVDFQQYSIKEYFCAVYVTQMDTTEMISFLTAHNEEDDYLEVICLITGLMQKEQEQNSVLDFLEITNLPLYVKCLKKRYNFSNKYCGCITKIVCENFFTQVLRTFEAIVDTHFYNFKCWLYPFSVLPDQKELDIKLEAKIRGSIDPIELTVNIELLSLENEDENKVMVEFSSNKPIVSTMKGEKEIIIPIQSFTDNRNRYYFDITKIYSGIDCAREIAVEIISKKIKNIFSSDLLLFDEPLFMQLCYVESALRAISPIKIRYDADNIIKYDLTFNKQTVEQLENIFSGIIDGSSKDISFFVIWSILKLNSNSDIDPKKVSFPYADINLDKPSGRVSEFYSMECITGWLQVYYDELQKSYRFFVDKLFPTIKNSMGMYQVGPFQYEINVTKPTKDQSGFGNYGSLRIRWVPKEFIEDCDTRIELQDYAEKEHTHEEFLKYSEDLKRKLKFFNRNYSSFFVESNAVLFSVFNSNNSVRTSVYNQLEKDIKEILE